MSDEIIINDLRDGLREAKTKETALTWVATAIAAFKTTLADINCDVSKESEHSGCPVSEAKYKFTCELPRLRSVFKAVGDVARTSLQHSAMQEVADSSALLDAVVDAVLARISGNLKAPACPPECPWNTPMPPAISRKRTTAFASPDILFEANRGVVSGTASASRLCFYKGFSFKREPATTRARVKGEHEANTSLVGAEEKKCESTDNEVKICSYVSAGEGVKTEARYNEVTENRWAAALSVVKPTLCGAKGREKCVVLLHDKPKESTDTFNAVTGEGRMCRTMLYDCRLPPSPRRCAHTSTGQYVDWAEARQELWLVPWAGFRGRYCLRASGRVGPSAEHAWVPTPRREASQEVPTAQVADLIREPWDLRESGPPER